jgi:hypothetical protein
VPTDGKPSPLFGAQPFSQKMLRFEEFGLERYDPTNNPQPSRSFPLPSAGRPPGQDSPKISSARRPSGGILDLSSGLGEAWTGG